MKNNTKVFRAVFFIEKALQFFFFLVLLSCQILSTEDKVVLWTKDVKTKILKDASLISDSIKVDSAYGIKTMHYFKNKVLLKECSFKKGEPLSVIYYSPSQKFKYVKELCVQRMDSPQEGIMYEEDWIGLIETRYCKGALKSKYILYRKYEAGTVYDYEENGELRHSIARGNRQALSEILKLSYY